MQTSLPLTKILLIARLGQKPLDKKRLLGSKNAVFFHFHNINKVMLRVIDTFSFPLKRITKKILAGIQIDHLFSEPL